MIPNKQLKKNLRQLNDQVSFLETWLNKIIKQEIYK